MHILLLIVGIFSISQVDVTSKVEDLDVLKSPLPIEKEFPKDELEF